MGLPQGMFLSQHLRIPLSGHVKRRNRMNEETKKSVTRKDRSSTPTIGCMSNSKIFEVCLMSIKYASRCDAKELHRSDGSNATAPSSPLFGRFIVTSRKRSSNLPKLTGGISVPFDLCVENDILLTSVSSHRTRQIA